MRVTLKNGVTLEFDSTGMAEDFRECETCKCNLKYQGLSVCEIPEVVKMLGEEQ